MSMPQKQALFTIASKNYLSFARTLLQSVRRHNENLEIFLLLADECDNYFDKSQEKFTVIEARELNIENYDQMAFRYNIVEFNTSLKPFFIDFLFRKGYEKVIYLDPDIMVFNSLAFVYDILERNSIILTPHLTRPLTINERCFPPENMFLLAGTFNLGFIGIGNRSDSRIFLEWWMRKCKTNCIIDFRGSGCFVDQKWCTLIPGFFDTVHILRHLGCNMAVWNLHERKISNGIINDKVPLIFFHFSGYNPDEKEIITKNQFEYTLNSRPDLREIFYGYTKAVFDNGYNDTKDWGYKYASFENGVQIGALARQLFPHVYNEYPFPFATGENSYFSLLSHKKLLGTQDSNPANIKSDYQLHEKNRYKTLLNLFFKRSARLLGPTRYQQMLAFLQREANPRDHDFLIK